jgi:hypothetical protein
MITILQDRGHRDEKIWTGAYLIRASREKGRNKVDFVIKDVVMPLEAALPAIRKSLKRDQSRRGVWEELKQIHNWGSFLAGQVADDLTWTPLLRNPVDDYTWAPIGPGSRRGFNRLMGRPLKASVKQTEFCEQLAKWRWEIVYHLGKDTYHDLTLMDVQNCLCELDKYLRVKNGEGRPRAKYRPETAY